MKENLPQNQEIKKSEYKYFEGPRDQAALDFLTDKEFSINDFENNDLSIEELKKRNKKLQEANRIKNNIERYDEKITNIFLTIEAGAVSSILSLAIWLSAGYRY